MMYYVGRCFNAHIFMSFPLCVTYNRYLRKIKGVRLRSNNTDYGI